VLVVVGVQALFADPHRHVALPLDLGLTPQTRVDADVEGLVEDVLLVLLGFRQELLPGLDVDVAGGASAHPAAGVAFRGPDLLRGAQDRGPDGHLHLQLLIDESYLGHQRASFVSSSPARWPCRSRCASTPSAWATSFSTSPTALPAIAAWIARFMRRPAQSWVAASSASSLSCTTPARPALCTAASSSSIAASTRRRSSAGSRSPSSNRPLRVANSKREASTRASTSRRAAKSSSPWSSASISICSTSSSLKP